MRAPLRSLLTIAAASTPIAVGLAVSPAHANGGVQYVDFSVDATPWCPEGALPAGYGGYGDCESNTVYVVQTQNADGVWAWTDVVGPNGSDFISVPLRLDARCNAGYRLNAQSRIASGAAVEGATGGTLPPIEFGSDIWYAPLAVNTNNRTIPERHWTEYIPVEDLPMWGGVLNDLPAAAGPFAEYLELFEDTSIASSRLTGFTEVVELDIHAAVVCRGTGLAHAEYWMDDPGLINLNVVFLGQGMEPNAGWRAAEVDIPVEPPPFHRPPTGGTPDLSVEAQVTQANLTVLADPDDSCRLHLSGAIVTNGQTEVQYRIVDHLGVKSQIFTADVDQAFTVWLDHHLDVVPSAEDGDTLGNFAPLDDGSGEFGYAAEDTDNLQGYFQIEVIEPHLSYSNIASYNLPPCVPTYEINLGTGSGDLIGTTRTGSTRN